LFDQAANSNEPASRQEEWTPGFTLAHYFEFSAFCFRREYEAVWFVELDRRQSLDLIVKVYERNETYER